MWEMGVQWRSNVCTVAASGGYLELLMWVRQKGCEWDEWTTYAAAHANQLETLKWAVDNGCTWKTAETFAFAARNNNLEMLKWSYEQQKGCFTEEMCANAAEKGNLEMLQWLRKEKCPWCQITCIVSLENRHFHVFKWAIQNGCPHDDKTYEAVILSGEEDLLRYFDN